MQITTHLDHVSRCKTTSGTNRSNGWTYRVFNINTRRDETCQEGESCTPLASEEGTTQKGLMAFYLKAKARIWP